jgi:serine/threonine-protein kinase RsbW
LARHVGSVVANARQLESTAQTSHELQAALLPAELPRIASLRVHTRYLAASSSLEVGGDFYDAMELPGGKAWMAIGDVEGHDRRAAAVMGQLRSAIRTLACEGNDPSEVIHALRTSWKYFGSGRLATILVGEIDPTSGRVVLASAGHLPPLLIKEAGAEFVSTAPNPLLGVEAETAEPLTLTLCPSDVLLLLTDGVLTERSRPLDEAMQQLRALALSAPRTPEDICSRVIEGRANGDDDAALLALALDPMPPAPIRPHG